MRISLLNTSDLNENITSATFQSGHIVLHMQYLINQISSGFICEYVHTCVSVSDVIFEKWVEALQSNVFFALYFIHLYNTFYTFNDCNLAKGILIIATWQWFLSRARGTPSTSEVWSEKNESLYQKWFCICFFFSRQNVQIIAQEVPRYSAFS